MGAAAIVAQLAAWAIQTLAAYAILYALNLQGNGGLAAAAAVLLAVNLAALVPITPSNIGIFQAATIAVLAAYGVDATHALAYGILLQAIEIITAIVLGVPALLAERISLNDIRRHATTPQPRYTEGAKAEGLRRHRDDPVTAACSSDALAPPATAETSAVRSAARRPWR